MQMLAAVPLSGFTQNWQALLVGVDIGGLGTPIASLASLIAIKVYLSAPGANAGQLAREFTLLNIMGLALMIGLWAVLGVTL